MNTSRFSGEKQVSIYVSFDRPQFEEVRLAVRANSRHDVTITPQTMHFGQIRRGSNVTKSVTVSFFGGGSWQVTKIAADSNYVLPKFREIKRDGYEIAYEVSASLRSDIPVGKWYSDIWLTTNHPTISKIRVPLTVEVQSALTVTPAVAVLDTVKVGQTVERKVIVRGEKPFRIVSVGGTNGELEVFAQDMKPKKLHVLTLRYHATGPAEPEWVIRVHTDLADEPEVVFQVKGRAVN
ncbi:MAG: hypothetical protein KatS3mg105_3616 [Gemmatales bacterium]|nr:MAG: hypothetical protein KatS3mg105_3616 [Gemmatales bacterium]